MTTVSVVIVNYNTRALLAECLQNLRELDEAAEILVVDNASSDGSADLVRTQFPQVRLIALSENRGLTVASNLALHESTGEFLLYLGADAFPKPGTIRGLAAYLHAHPTVGIATAKLLLRDGSVDLDAHRGFPTPWAALTHFTGISRLFPRSKRLNQYFLGHEDLDQAHEIDLCISHFLFVRRSLFAHIGPWDEDFFLYGEDVDLCYRAKAAGYQIMYLPQFEALHYKGASVGVRAQTRDIASASPETRLRATQLSTKAMTLFYQKHFTGRYPAWLTALVLGGIRGLGAFRLWRTRRALYNLQNHS